MGPTLRAALIGLAAVFAVEAAHAQAYDRHGWLADFAQMQDAIARESPNLDWAIARGLDLPKLSAETRSRISAARDDAGARAALLRFGRFYGDGHMELSWPAAATPSSDPEPQDACVRLGYVDRGDEGAVGRNLAGYERVSPDGAYVEAGVAHVGARRLGVLRIPLFAPPPSACPAALAELGLAPDRPCDEACADRVARRADARFIAEIEAGVRALHRHRADVLLVDIAGNGGGDDSAVAIARILGGAGLRTPRVQPVRSSARAKDLEEDQADLRAAAASASTEDRRLLDRLIAAHDEARRQAASPCDRSPVWRGERSPCSQLVAGPSSQAGWWSKS